MKTTLNTPLAAHFDLAALQSVIGFASSYLEDIETGIQDGTYSADDNKDLAAHQAALKKIESLAAAAVEPASTPMPSAEREMISALESLVPHVLHYASMPHASSDAHRNAADARSVIAKHQQTVE